MKKIEKILKSIEEFIIVVIKNIIGLLLVFVLIWFAIIAFLIGGIKILFDKIFKKV